MVLFSAIAYIFLIFGWHLPVSTQYAAKISHCKQDVQRPELVLVSTLDGLFTALNSEGELFWQIETGPGSLLDSNIHNLELNNNGEWARLIPSLSGNLYKFNGITIDATPISAETLLASSFRYSDDLLIAGGQEVRTYGIQLATGKQLYECLLSGCRNTTNEQDDLDDVLVLERKTHTIRAVEPRTGAEKWNFSVGQHNIKLPFLDCVDTNLKPQTYNINAVMPEGLITAHTLGKTSEILWQYKFEVPLVAIWRWNGRELIPWDLFDTALQSTNNKIADQAASIYLGMHNRQLYVHESAKMKNLLDVKMYLNKKQQAIDGKSLAQIPWNPKPASSVIKDVSDNTAFSVLYGSEYEEGNGYYLHTAEENSSTYKNTSKHIIAINKIKSSLFWTWKEFLFITIFTAVAFALFFNKVVPQYLRVSSVGTSTSQSNQNSSGILKDIYEPKEIGTSPPFKFQHSSSLSESSDGSGIFISRYTSEFEHISCLGKGGFGVVFQARKKFDECDYAVKRIRLPNGLAAKQRMMREVKALAKLDHRNIVRYYNAWLEYPPSEWQRQYDEQWLSDYSMSYTEKSLNPEDTSRVIASYSIDVEDSSSAFKIRVDSLRKQISVSKDYTSSSIIFERDSAESNQLSISNRSHSTSNETELMEEEGVNKYDDSCCPVFLYIQMQLCRKESLKEWLNNNLNRNDRCIYIFKQIVDAVEYVHNQGLIHRDLKPSNIFFSLDDQIKVGDFGLVTSINDYDQNNDDDNNSGILKSYTNAVGTHLYMSPEQVNGQQYDFKVDIYSLGIIFFELLVSFNTEMERINTLTDLRKHCYPKDFKHRHENHNLLLESMLSDNPLKRPIASDIKSKLFNN